VSHKSFQGLRGQEIASLQELSFAELKEVKNQIDDLLEK
jgi:hypothetical protein